MGFATWNKADTVTKKTEQIGRDKSLALFRLPEESYRNYEELSPSAMNRFVNVVATKSGKHGVLVYPCSISLLEISRYLPIPLVSLQH